MNTKLSGLARSRSPCFLRSARARLGARQHAAECCTDTCTGGRQVEREWVGLRPGRPSVRLEAERVALPPGDGRPEGALSVVHCYGARPGPCLSGSDASSDVTRRARRRND